MQEQKRILVADIERDPQQPRKHFDEAELLALGQNMLALGQIVPILVVPAGKRFVCCDGEKRWRASQIVGITELDAMLLKDSSETARRIAQMCIDAHRSNLSSLERSDFLHKIEEENGWSVNDLAANLHMKQPLVSKLRGLQRLGPEARKALEDGEIDTERAHTVSMASDHAKQLELLQAATQCSRDGLRRKARGVTTEPKVSAAKFTMPGYTISVSGKSIDLPTAVEVLSETVRVLKKSLSQNLTLDSVQRVMKDTAKAH
jgi:ParB family chromosome partitioning protein